MEKLRPRAGGKLRCLCVGISTVLGFALWTAGAGAQMYPATETLQLSSSGQPPGDGLLHVGAESPEAPQYRALVRFDLPAIDPDRLLAATLVLEDAACYYGDIPPVTARPILSDWNAETTWDGRPETGDEAGEAAGGDCPSSEGRIDVTTLVRDWSTGAVSNLGVELRGDESGFSPQADRRLAPVSGVSLEVELLSQTQTIPTQPGSGLAPVLLAGVLVDEYGAPVRGGAVSVSPSVGAEGSEEAVELASAETDASGAFVVRLSPADPAIAAAAAANDGWVTFDAAFLTGTRVQFRSFSRRAEGGSWVAGEAQVHVQFDSTAAIGSQAPGVRTALSELDTGHPRPGCYLFTTRLGELDRYMVIGEAHVWKDQALTWAYGEQADSNIGVGYSTDGIHWSLSGSMHVGNKRSAQITDTISNLGDDDGNFGRRYRSEFHFVKERQRRVCLGRSATVYRIRATRWNGGFDYYDDVKDLNGHCGDRYVGTAVYFTPASGKGTFRRASEDLRTYTAAVTVFGVSLSGQTGASKSSSQTWRFGRHFTRYYLCGDTGKPTVAERIFAGF